MLIATILIYSGRENPRWEIDGPAERDVLGRLASLAEVRCGPAAPPGLGYSGIELMREPGGERWTLHAGVVRSGEACFADSGRTLERALVALGRARLGERIPANLV